MMKRTVSIISIFLLCFSLSAQDSLSIKSQIDALQKQYDVNFVYDPGIIQGIDSKEITLSGKVWPVGGIKEKMLAAYRYGVKTVLLPKRNLQDLDELPDNVRKQMQFIPVEHLDDVLQVALEEAHE